MTWIRSHRPSPGTAFGFAALMVALGGVAFAAIPDSNGTIHACYQTRSGNLRVVESQGDCRGRERALDWNLQGPTGATGPQGPPGESSNVKVLRSLVLNPGDRQNLFQAGSLTFTARCEPFDSGLGAIVDITTSQDHAVFSQLGGSNVTDLLAGQTVSLAAAGATPSSKRRNIDVDFTATSPDRTVVTGIFSIGANLGNDPGECLIGGFVAINQ